MSSPLLTLEPQSLWQHFDDIRQIPRPSKHEERIVEHVLDWARKRGFKTRSDAVSNLVVHVPAPPGRESAPTVVLQAHLDMVCEKNADVTHDFMKDPIEVVVEDDWVRAVGTTLGSDNGIGAAMAMAAAEDPTLDRGPLELLLTVDEETGLTGAASLDGSLISGKILINLDSEEDGAIYIGCAGGGDLTATLPLERAPAAAGSVLLKLAISGLRGGHSGLDIEENRANALKLAARCLRAARGRGLRYDLISIDGGSKHNAIPREAFVLLRAPEEDVAGLESLLTELQKELGVEYGAVEPEMRLGLEAMPARNGIPDPMTDESGQQLIHTLNGIPHGVLTMSREVKGLVETSHNVAICQTDVDAVRVSTCYRSSVGPALLATQDSVRSICELAGGTVETYGVYPGWKPNPDSPVVQKTVEVYTTLFDEKPALRAVHAGLECGLLLEKVPGLDAVSFGPEIRGAHSPDEKVQISSTAKCYRLLGALLAALAEG